MSFPARVARLAREHPAATAITFSPLDGDGSTLTWADLEAGSSRAADVLRARGVDDRSTVVIVLPNCPEHFTCAVGAWRLGACVLPLDPALTPRERGALIALAGPAVVVSERPEPGRPTLLVSELGGPAHGPPLPLPDVVARPGRALASGGSTGLPKLIVDDGPWALTPGRALGELGWTLGLRPGQVQLVAGPLHHGSAFAWAYAGLFDDQRLVLMGRFHAAHAVDLVERHRANFVCLVPTMMRRMLEVPGIDARDLSSLQAVVHTGGPCPPSTKERWIRLLGPERVFEAYGASEAIGVVVSRGDEWLRRPGTIGRPHLTELRILDEHHDECPAGTVGEIYMRPLGAAPPGRVAGAGGPAVSPDGLRSAGDMGWVDADGYVYLAGRRGDMIVTGGANVYPAEVEAVLMDHPSVRDAAVVGLPDEEWGARVHAVLEAAPGCRPPTGDELARHCRARLAAFKVPKSFELTACLPRSEAGKLRKARLAQQPAAARTG